MILAPNSIDFRDCYKFDMRKNEWIKLASYPDEIDARCHSFAIDQDKHLLYLSHGHKQIFIVYNLLNNKWKIIANNGSHNVAKGAYNATSIVLSNHEFHLLIFSTILTSSAHIFWNEEQNQFCIASKNGIENNCYINGPCFMFIPKRNLLMAIGGYLATYPNIGYTDLIWYTQYDGINKDNYEWKRFEIRLPEGIAQASCVIAFDAVLIVGYQKSIWILDLECDGKYEWREPKLNCGQYPIRCCLVLSKDNDLYFINTCAYQEKQVHSRIHLSRFIPNDIYIKYNK